MKGSLKTVLQKRAGSLILFPSDTSAVNVAVHSASYVVWFFSASTVPRPVPFAHPFATVTCFGAPLCLFSEAEFVHDGKEDQGYHQTPDKLFIQYKFIQ